MLPAPTHNELLEAVTTGRLFLEQDGNRTFFCLRDESIDLWGRLYVRPDWTEQKDDRAGLMPVIGSLEDTRSGYYEEGHDPAVGQMYGIYEALRARLSPAKFLQRVDGRWMLSACGSQ